MNGQRGWKNLYNVQDVKGTIGIKVRKRKMNTIGKQLLINQYEMMAYFNDNGFFSERIKQTEELIEPRKSEEDCCEMDAQELLDDFAKRGNKE